MSADRLFDPRTTDPLRIVRHHHPDGVWVAVCNRCGARLRYRNSATEAERAGLEALPEHTCTGPSELPESF